MTLHETNPQQNDPNQLYPTAAEQVSLAEEALIVTRECHRNRELPGSLTKGKTFAQSLYSGDALARETTPTGMEDMTHLIVVGSKHLALSRTMIEGEDSEGNPTWSLKSVRLSQLSLDGEGRTAGPARVLKEVYIPSLKETRADGIVTPWDESTFGREQLGEKGEDGTLYADSTVSRAHFKLRVEADGMFRITDLSTNGTTVLGVQDLHASTEKEQPVASALNGVVSVLQKYPAMW